MLGLPGLAALALLASCGREHSPPEALTREAFVAVYVDLRVAALQGGGDDDLDEQVRDSILEAHGVTQEQVLAFAEGRATDLEFMRDLWNEIEARLDSVPDPTAERR